MMKTVCKGLVNTSRFRRGFWWHFLHHKKSFSCGGKSSAYTFVSKELTPKSTGVSSLFQISMPFGRYTSIPSTIIYLFSETTITTCIELLHLISIARALRIVQALLSCLRVPLGCFLPIGWEAITSVSETGTVWAH